MRRTPSSTLFPYTTLFRSHQETALALARWLAARPEVEQVLHPALPGTPGHEFWKRDFGASSGLFGVVLKPCPPDRIDARSEEHTSELQSLRHLVCRLLLEK